MKRGHTIDLIFALVLMLIFTVCLLLVLSSGAMSYKNIAGALESQYQERSCLSYIASKFRHYDSYDAIEVSEFGGGDALFFHETIGGEPYITKIYYYDGRVRELFTAPGFEFHPSTGEEIVPAGGLMFEDLGGGLVRVVCVGPDGAQAEIFLTSRSGAERGQRA
jgi:hypothetical protein